MGIAPEKSKSRTSPIKKKECVKAVRPNKISPLAPKAKTLNNRTDSGKAHVRAKAPLTLEDLKDEDAEGVTQDWEIDLWAKADLDWSNEAAELKQLHHKFKNTSTSQLDPNDRAIFSEDFIFGFFKTLRLVDKKISRIDEDAKKLRNLKELSLTGNLIESFESRNLPHDLQILHLNANKLTNCPNISELQSLLHFGASYNIIKSIDGFKAPASLISLDLSGNELCDLQETVNALAYIPNLQILALFRNPLFLIEGYRKTVVSKVSRLAVLDEVNVSISERTTGPEVSTDTIISPAATPEIILMIKLQEMTGLFPPIIDEPADSRPPDEILYFFEAIFNGYNNARLVCSDPIPWAQDMMDIASTYCVSFPVTKAVRDAFDGKMSLKLYQKRYTFVPVLNEAMLSTMSMAEGSKPGTRPGSSMRPVSGGKKDAPRAASPKKDAGKKGVADKGKKGAKGKKDDDIQYERKLVGDTELAITHLELKPFLEGQKAINGDFHLERLVLDAPVPILVSTLRASVKMPTKEEQAAAKGHQRFP
ncbi:outer arm dynein light chain 1 [Rhizoclosmatium globosum]|uniref:Outer arm dynein light chain 1 n=1 Tax=Rhizoclosmatium globosum TaxID=329046 RepID=A0A1Y2BNK7_9FUNG|nr:outer arm dynein light chain 1 [Rhizoclosmatium globosum]|eukprot:ORY36157.1 outer arm dynein light chain 1 [Rhizoclosmatium globosum]